MVMRVSGYRCAVLAGWLTLAAGSVAAGGQTRNTSEGAELLLSDPVVVTASRKTQRASDAPAAVTVVTAEQIEASGATTLLDILRYAPGVDVSESSRSFGSVSIRGFNEEYANKLLVMVDGRSIYQDYFGGVFWNTNPLLLARIKRIEIVRGSGSALYGANAVNGVINVILKTPAEMAAGPVTTTGRALLGEHNTQLLEAQATVGDPRGWSFSVGSAYNHTDGFSGRQAGLPHDSYGVSILTLDAQKRTRRGSLVFSEAHTEGRIDMIGGAAANDRHVHNNETSLTY